MNNEINRTTKGISKYLPFEVYDYCKVVHNYVHIFKKKGFQMIIIISNINDIFNNSFLINHF